jgi:hypothetical protein
MVLLALASFKIDYGQQNNGDKKQDKTAQIQNLVNSKNFVFVAQTALPLSGRSINLTTPYNLKVSGDTVVSDLPYFGRTFVAPMNPSGGGIHFKSANANYTVKERKKGGWDVTILPKDAEDVRQMFLSITEEGYATLQVISNNRQSIGYNGYIDVNRNKAIAVKK